MMCKTARTAATRMLAGRVLVVATAGIALLAIARTVSPARALEEQKGEAQAIDACDKRLCAILQQKSLAGEDLKCALTKTWARSTLKEADQPQITWGFGDARCSIVLDIGRASLVEAMTSTKTHKFWVPPHTASCIIEQDGQAKPLKATVAPKIAFKDGKAEKIWINLLHIEGSTGLKGWLSAAAQLTDSVGIFHRSMIKSVNGYIYRHCPKYYPQAQAAKPSSKAK